MASGATPTDTITLSVAVLQGQPTSSSKSLNTSPVSDEISTTLVGAEDQDSLDGSSTSGEQVAAFTTTATPEEGSQNKKDTIDANDDEDMDEDNDDDNDDEDGDSDPDFPKFPDNGRGRIVGPVAGQKPKPRP
ncbi:hypothetical protein CPC08DRAFT_702289, partial [Agrocybe pediades]